MKKHVKKWLKNAVPVNSKHHFLKGGAEVFELRRNFVIVRK